MSSLIKVIKMTAVGFMLASLLACGSGGGVEAVANFKNTNDIKEGTQVFLNDKAVGEISDVSTQEEGTTVTINFDQDFADQISSKAAVVVNRLKEGGPVEIYNRGDASVEPLQAGQEIIGLDSMFQLGSWMIGDVIKIGANSVSEYVEAFQGYLGSDQFENDKAALSEQLETATESAKEAISSLEGVVVTMDEQLELAADPLEEYSKELAPLVEELTAGGSELMAELERFTEGLEAVDEDEQEAGEMFLDSLLATMEKLNDEMEEEADLAEQDKIPAFPVEDIDNPEAVTQE